MDRSKEKTLEKFYPLCRSMLGSDVWNRILEGWVEDSAPETFPDTLAQEKGAWVLPGFFPELARLEWNFRMMGSNQGKIPAEVEKLELNPTLRVFQLSWKNLPLIIRSNGTAPPAAPEPGEEWVLIWKDPKCGEAQIQTPSSEDLLVLKMVGEEIPPEEVASSGQAPVAAIDAAIGRAVKKGILLRPKSRLRRDPVNFPVGKIKDDAFLSASVFTLQWHITQACDLHCRHCYDRSRRPPLKPDQGLEILDDLRSFCRSRNVKGQVSFSGGNPFLYPHFIRLYRAAAEWGFSVAILGNPTDRAKIEELLPIQRPVFFQVSLEGLQEHNDGIRGEGHFARVMKFLDVLRELKIYSMVMLTLTRDNLDQVLPLAEVLRDRTDLFTFNRLSQVGEGAKLALPSPRDYAAFLEAYVKAGETNPVVGLKENLLSIVHEKKGLEPFGGCCGYGCGAAFNFLALLPDGEVHACRKFPSLLGNIHGQSLAEIYDSPLAERYRTGSKGCTSCSIRPVCGGCPAVVHGSGLDIFEHRDPFCFF